MIGGTRQIAEYGALSRDLAALQILLGRIEPQKQTILDAAGNAEALDGTLIGDIQDAISLADQISDELEPIGDELENWSSLIELVTQILDELYQLWYAPAFVQTGSTLADLTPVPTRVYTVRQGDTLEEIAYSQLGSAERWAEIVEYNALDLHAELTSAWIGTVLQLPVRVERTAPSEVAEVWALATGVEALGRDLPNAVELTTGGDLAVLDPVTSFFSGISNLLLTGRGSIPTNPRWGSLLGDLLGEDFGDLTSQTVGVEIKRALNTDARIRGVGSITVKKENDSLACEFNITTIVGDNQAIRLALPTIPGGGYEVRALGETA